LRQFRPAHIDARGRLRALGRRKERAPAQRAGESRDALDNAAERNIKSQTSDDMLDLSFLSLSREAWQMWKRKRAAR
jgi:hypothetical protein